MENLIIKLKQNPFLAYAINPPIAEMTGKTLESTYYGDFLVCLENENAIRDTYKRALGLAKSDITYGTELSLVLNWLCWDFSEYNPKIARVYEELWREWNAWVLDHYKGEDLDHYLREID